MKKRLNYLDVARFIGMFCIYLGHFEDSAGKAHPFVFTFHVALFFFLSGCTETLSEQLPWHKYLIKTVKSILIPFYIFAFSSLLVRSISIDSAKEIPSYLAVILKGCIRNEFIAGSLWFLSALFVMKLVFYFMQKLLRFKVLILIGCLGCFVVANTLIDPSPLVKPHLIFNLDSVCYYILFYGMGYCCFGWLRRLLAWDRLWKKICCAGVGSVLLLYAAALFFGKDPLTFLDRIPALAALCALVRALLMIALVLIVAKALENLPLLGELGRNSLYLCGSEYIIKLLAVILLYTLGLGLSMPDPLSAYLYSFILLVVCNKTLVPIEKALFKKLRLL